MAEAVRYIVTHWTSGKTLLQIADMHEVDPGNLVRSFRRQHGCTPKQYIDHCRKEFVLAHIKTNRGPAYEIGEMLGMEDLAFYRWAKRVFGRSYTHLREEIDKRH